MGEPILACARQCYATGILPDFLRRGALRLIPKPDKDKRESKNWRPLILQEALYKLLSGALANRLNKALDILVHKSQTGFIRGRSMCDNVRIVHNIVELCKEFGNKGILVSCDLEKAFDSISFRFIRKVLRFFGFGFGFTKWVEILLNGFQVEIINSGYILAPFMQERAVRQGDPASTGLFILGMEILLIRIRSNSAIKKLHIENINVGTSGYADDVNILLKYDRQSLIELKKDLNNFYSISGLKTNLNKTSCMFFGRPEGQENLIEPFQNTGFDWTNELSF